MRKANAREQILDGMAVVSIHAKQGHKQPLTG
jgi:hypothetical protein